MNADSEIFVCTDEVTKVTTDHAGTEWTKSLPPWRWISGKR